MDDIKRKSLKEVLPKRGLAVKEKELPPVKRAELADYYKARQGRGGVFFVWILIIIVLFIAGYYLSNYFTLVTIKVVPKQTTVIVDGQYQAEKTPGSAPLLFSTVTAEDSAQIMIPFTGSQPISKKASGRVVIYNNYSTASQTLTSGTRLEMANGKIFRLNKTTVIPGQKKSGKNITPGAVEVDVTADQAGSSYNVGLTDFHLTGFKGTAKYDKFVARAKTAIGGGMVGEIKIVSDDDKAKARATLQKTLADRLVKKTRMQVPKDFVLFDDAIILNFSDSLASSSPDVALAKADSSSFASSTNQIAFTEQINLTGVLFNRKNLAKQLLARADNPAANKDDNITISNIDNLQFKLLNKISFDPDKTNKISFTLSGQAKVVWVVNREELKTKLAGTSIRDKDKIFAGYPNIFKVETAIRPPWIINFPADQTKMVIEVSTAK